MLKIGVRLPGRFEDVGDYLADARALDAAGVDSLWLDHTEHDPWMLLAWIAAVTGRARLVVPTVASDGRTASALLARMKTLDRLSRGRAALVIDSRDGDRDAVEAAVDVARRSGRRVILWASSDRE